MTYAAASALGAASDWPDIGRSAAYQSFWRNIWSTSEVYAFRFRATGMPSTIESVSQVYPLVKAYVQSMPLGDRNQDVRGVTLTPTGASGSYLVDLVVTDAGGIHLSGVPNADDLYAAAMNEKLAATGTSIRVDRPAMTVLNTANKAAYAHWFAQSPIWSYKAFKASESGGIDAGFTRAYLDGRGVWLNSTAVNPQFELAPRKQPEIAPPGGSLTPGGQLVAGVDRGAIGWYVGAGALAVLAGFLLVGRRDRRR